MNMLSTYEDIIYIRDLHLRAIIGINDWEREKAQDLLVNLEIFTDLSKAAISDDIKDTVNYRFICKQIISLVENSQFFLIETLANEISKLVLKNMCVSKVTVSIDKPAALRFSKSVAVKISRYQK